MRNIKKITLTMSQLEQLVIAANKKGLAREEIIGFSFHESVYGLKLPIFELKPKQPEKAVPKKPVEKRGFDTG